MSTEQRNQKLKAFFEEKERRERLEHRDVLLSIASLIKTPEGQRLFEYLFKNLDVGILPPKELKGENLHEHLGFLRAGNSIYKLACEAASESAASISASLERKRYEDIYHQYRIESGEFDTDDDGE